MNVALEKSVLAAKRETVLAMKREGKRDREIAAAVGMSVNWVALHWSKMRRDDPRAAAVPSGRAGRLAKGRSPEEESSVTRPAAWDFSGDNLDSPEGDLLP